VSNISVLQHFSPLKATFSSTSEVGFDFSFDNAFVNNSAENYGSSLWENQANNMSGNEDSMLIDFVSEHAETRNCEQVRFTHISKGNCFAKSW